MSLLGPKLYTDGGIIGSNPSPYGGTWAYILVLNDNIVLDFNFGAFAPNTKFTGYVTNNQSEYLAILKGLRSLDKGWNGMLCSDSRVSLGRIFEGWKTKNIPNDTVRECQWALARLGDVDWELVSGHPSKAELAAGRCKKGRRVSKWNVKCDELCKSAGKLFMSGMEAASRKE